jgi:FtsP/CotA-like multicopper oxidase with cupredoxin domain
MSGFHPSRRNFLKAAGAVAGATLLSPPNLSSQSALAGDNEAASPSEGPADYTLTIATTPIELAPNRIISVTNYNGQFPGPLLRLKEGERRNG